MPGAGVGSVSLVGSVSMAVSRCFVVVAITAGSFSIYFFVAYLGLICKY